jgi:hypothetical protein
MYPKKHVIIDTLSHWPKVHINADLRPQGLVVNTTVATRHGVSANANLQIPWCLVGWGAAGFVAGGVAAHLVNEAEQRRDMALRARRKARRRRLAR